MLGTGTVNDPYQITTRADLEAINNDLTACYKLMNDIDLSDSEWTPLCNGGVFTGQLDGNGKKISNMKIRHAVGVNVRTGLIDRTNGAIIKKLGIENADIITNYHYAGVIVGSSYNTRFDECYTTGRLEQVGGFRYAGGFTSYAGSGATFYDCWSDVDLITGTLDYYGGFVGYPVSSGGTKPKDTQFHRCFAIGTITANNGWNGTGGFYGKISTSIGYDAVFSNCEYDKTTLGRVTSTTTGVLPRDTDYMQTASNYYYLSNDIWTVKDGAYPSLKAFEERVVVVIEDRNVVSYMDNVKSSVMLNKVANQKIVSSINRLSADTQKIIKSVKVGTTFVRDIVSGVSREMQIVKVGNEKISSYILPITSNIEVIKQQVRLLEETVTSHIKPITSDVQREIKSLRQSLSFVDVIVGRAITPNLKPEEIKAIVSHLENGTLSQYLSNQYGLNALENETLVEVRE